MELEHLAWIAPSAEIYGNVSIGHGSSIWPRVVIRAEARHVRIGRMTNLQDFVMVHVGYESPTEIGDFCSITHHATVHGCRIGDGCLVGINAVIMEDAEVGAGSIVAAGAVVPQGRLFGPHSIIAGVPARQIGERDCSRENRLNAWQYVRNAEFYRRGQHRAWDGAEYRAWLAAKQAEIEEDRDLAALV